MRIFYPATLAGKRRSRSPGQSARVLGSAHAALAQRIERRVSTPGREGSSPSGGTMLLAPDKTGSGLLSQAEWVQVLPGVPTTCGGIRKTRWAKDPVAFRPCRFDPCQVDQAV